MSAPSANAGGPVNMQASFIDFVEHESDVVYPDSDSSYQMYRRQVAPAPAPAPMPRATPTYRRPQMPANMDKKTQIATFMASRVGFGAARPAIEKVTVDPPQVSRPRPGPQHFVNKIKLDRLERDVCSFNDTPVKKPFGSTKSKELDSGIISLETPSCLAAVSTLSSPMPSPTLSTISSPATFSEPTNTPAGSVTSGSSSPPSCSPPAAPAPSYFAAAHDAVALAEIKRSFGISQEINPAEAAVFVGNLPAGLTDLQLSYELVNAFKVFGHVDVKVSRHYTAEAVKPTAILQFTHPIAAFKAITSTRDWRIGGRKLRVDRSSAPRHLTVWRSGVAHPSTTPGIHWSQVFAIEEREAAKHFHRFGPIEFIKYFTSHWTFLGAPARDGVRIKFTNYGGFLAAKKAIQSGALPYREKRAYRPGTN